MIDYTIPTTLHTLSFKELWYNKIEWMTYLLYQDQVNLIV